MGRRNRKGRALNGVLIVSKPKGLTSNQALQRIRWLYQAKKAGHTGTLDPLATGVLPICFGEATKFSSFLLDADKVYKTTISLGVKTTTGDVDGDVAERQAVPPLTESTIEQVLSQFVGEYNQVPPMYSALKHQGRALYDWAREGVEIERKSRLVHIYSIDLLDWDSDSQELSVRVHCSKGTYIRVLGEDVGAALGTCAHLASLEREAAGAFTQSQAVAYDLIQACQDEETKVVDRSTLDRWILPMSVLFNGWSTVVLSGDCQAHVLQGRKFALNDAVEFSQGDGYSSLVCLMNEERDVLGVGERDERGFVQPKRMISVPIEVA